MTWSRSGFWLALMLVASLGIALRVLHLAPALGSDDQHWILVARHFAGGEAPDLVPVYFTRAVFQALLALWGQPFAISVPAATPLMLVVGAATTILVGLVGRAGFGPVTGLVAAGFYAVHPLTVTYDPYVVPDGLANCFEAAFLLMVALYLKDRVLRRLLFAGVLAGLMFGTKSYYILVGLPVGLILLLEPRVTWTSRVQTMTHLFAGLIIGLAVSFILQAISNGDPLAEFHANSGYSDRLLSRGDIYAGKTGIAAAVYIAITRLEYLSDLFVGSAGLLGWICLGGMAWGLARAVHEPLERVLVSVALTFLLFLMMMPVSLSPLVLVETQSRYLIVVLTPLAPLAAAWTVRVFGDIGENRVRNAAIVVLIAGLIWCAWIPSGWWDRYAVLETMGIREAARQCAGEQTGELLLANEWQLRYPKEISTNKTSIVFQDFNDDLTGQHTVDWLRQDSSRCVLLVRTPLRMLRTAIAGGGDVSDLELGPGFNLKSAFARQGIVGREVFVPEDTFRVWLDRLGVKVRGQLVGWIYRAP